MRGRVVRRQQQRQRARLRQLAVREQPAQQRALVHLMPWLVEIVCGGGSDSNGNQQQQQHSITALGVVPGSSAGSGGGLLLGTASGDLRYIGEPWGQDGESCKLVAGACAVAASVMRVAALILPATMTAAVGQ